MGFSLVTDERQPDTKPKSGGFTLVNEPVNNTSKFESELSSGPYLSQTEKTAGDAERQRNPSFFDFLTGKDRETDYTRNLPEFRRTDSVQKFGTNGKFLDQLKMTAGIMSTLDTNAQMDIIKKHIPEAQFFKDEKNNIIVDVNGKQSIINKPGFSGQDAVSALTSLLVTIPAGYASGLAKSVLGKAAAAGAASMATEQANQEFTRYVGSEQGRSPFATVLAGVFGVAPELASGVVKAVRNRSYIKEMGATPETMEAAIPNVKLAEQAEKETGIGLWHGQKTEIPAQLHETRFLASLPESQSIAYNALKKQNKEAWDATNKLLDTISDSDAVVKGPSAFRKAATDVVEDAAAQRTKASSGYYTRAFLDKRDVPTKDIQTYIDGRLSRLHSDSSLYKELERIKKLVSPERAPQGAKAPPLTLEKLQNAKFEIDKILDGTAVTSFDKQELATIGDVKKMLVSKMESRSPLYKKGNDIFKSMSPGVEEVTNSIIGKASRVEDTTLKDLAGKIFTPGESNPEVIFNAKKLIESKDPQAWRQLLRARIEDLMGKIRENPEAVESVANLPAQIHSALFGNEAQRRILYKSADKDVSQNLFWLETALKRAQKGRDMGSPTAFNTAMNKKYDTSWVSFFSNMVKSPSKTIGEKIGALGGDAVRESNIKAAADILFDPKYKPELKKIKGLGVNTKAGSSAMIRLINRAVSDRGGDINNE